MMTSEPRLRFNQGVMENLLRISQQYLDDGQEADALRTLETYIEAKPSDSEALGLRGRGLFQLGRHAEAAEAYAEAIKLSARAEYYLARARCFRAEGLPAEALACLDVARVQLGELTLFEIEAMDCERELKQYDAALDRNLKLLKNPGPNEELLEIRGDLYAEAGMDDEALAAWQQALKSLESAAIEGVAVPAGVSDRIKEKISVLGGNLGD